LLQLLLKLLILGLFLSADFNGFGTVEIGGEEVEASAKETLEASKGLVSR